MLLHNADEMGIGRLFGIEIRIDFSWLFVFALVAWSLSSSLGPFHSVTANNTLRLLLGVLTALLFFLSVLAHELAHSLVARSRGIPIRRITLFIFGGVSSFEGEPTTAPSAAWIALVGPAASLVIGVFFLFAAITIGVDRAFGAAAGYLAYANIAIAGFNLLPAFPLDGGRVLHAILWSRFKDRMRATRVTVGVGRVLAWIIIALGIYETLAFGFGEGLWITFIGWFLLEAGRAEALQTEMSAALKGHNVEELAEPTKTTLRPNSTGGEALELMRSQGTRVLPVTLGDQLLGIVTLSDFAKTSAEDLAATFVTALMTRTEDLKAITPDTNANEVLRLLVESGHHQLPILDSAGGFRGFVTAQGILRWVALDRNRLLTNIDPKH